jgi:hypothetical protein
MASNVTVVHTCDVRGDTVSAAFSPEVTFDGKRFRTDLCPAHEIAFRLAVTPFLRTALPQHPAEREPCLRTRGRRRS